MQRNIIEFFYFLARVKKKACIKGLKEEGQITFSRITLKRKRLENAFCVYGKVLYLHERRRYYLNNPWCFALCIKIVY